MRFDRGRCRRTIVNGRQLGATGGVGMRKAADPSDLITTSVLLARGQLRRLAALAARERRSRSFVLRDLIDEALTRRGSAPERAAG